MTNELDEELMVAAIELRETAAAARSPLDEHDRGETTQGDPWNHLGRLVGRVDAVLLLLERDGLILPYPTAVLDDDDVF